MKTKQKASTTSRCLVRALAVCLLAVSSLGHGLADAEAVSGEILVKLFRADVLPPLLSKYGLTTVSQFGTRPIYRLKATSPLADAHLIVEALAVEPGVLIAQENTINASPEARKNRVFAIGTQADYAAQWAPATLRLPQVHALSTGVGVRVAVLDSGVDFTHPLLAGKLLVGKDFVDGDLVPAEVGTYNVDKGFGHGTHVAGIVATAAPGAKIMPLRVLDAQGQGNTWVLAEALLYAVDPDGNPATDDGAHVINMSLGSPERTELLDTIARLASCAIVAAADPLEPEADFSDPGYSDDKSRCANSRGAVLVAAAGNDSSKRREFPAGEGAYGLIAVGASTEAHRRADFSNFGSWVHLAAPGDAVTSSVPGGGFGTWSGTSMATPWVSATAALLISADPLLTPDRVVPRIVRSTARLCGTRMRELDPLAAVTGGAPRGVTCP
ncbi:MAG: S8 family serine peptidase [Burkholderiaceae bacterium]